MKVFISWSGPRSMAMAEALKEWIPLVLQDVECFFSSEDIRAGQRWGAEIQGWLAETDFGVLCVTPENMGAPWLNFEAGALSKKLGDESRVVPVTLGFSPGNLDEPLKQFNGVQAIEVGLLKLMKSLAEVGKASVDIERTFARWWPDLSEKLEAIPDADAGVALPEPPNQDELLAEIHSMVRGISRDFSRVLVTTPESLYESLRKADQFTVNGKTMHRAFVKQTEEREQRPEDSLTAKYMQAREWLASDRAREDLLKEEVIRRMEADLLDPSDIGRIPSDE